VPAVDVDQIDQTVPDVMMEIRNEPHVVSVFPGYSQVKTEWMMTLRVDAEDPTEAQTNVERELLPQVLGILDTVTSSWRPFRAKVIGVLDLATGQRSHVFTSIAIPLRRHENLKGEDGAVLERRLETIQHSEVARRATVRMRQGVELLDLGRETFDDLAVLRMFTAIEGIVADVVKEERSTLAAGIEQELAQLVDQLEELLTAAAEDTKGRVQAVRETTGKIREQNLETIRRQMEAAGGVLGLSREDVEDAKELAKFRNEQLGHFAKEESPDALGPWAGHRAFELCKTFLSRYLDRNAAGT
jgi:ElaB/YqjD/DUF883 family membrane-anchored ribosome-binding protein